MNDKVYLLAIVGAMKNSGGYQGNQLCFLAFLELGETFTRLISYKSYYFDSVF